MKKNKKKKVPPQLWAMPYETLGKHVYLGRTSPKVRERARDAGLMPMNAKEWRKLLLSMQAIQRINYQGCWHDTVKYHDLGYFIR